MLLFVFEGADREPAIFTTLEKLFFIHPSGKQDEIVTYTYGTSFHSLHKTLHDEEIGLLEHLREKAASNKNEKLRENYDVFLKYREKDFSEIFLFFDYDFHVRMNLEQWNSHLHEMLTLFDNETENGKLYISYPMMESIRYTKTMPDANYHTYCVKREDCPKIPGNPKSGFKFLASEFSDYKGLAFIQLDGDNYKDIMQNWQCLKVQNVSKANFICTGRNENPKKKEDVAQVIIFENQLAKFVNTDECCVSILNAYPLFLYEYFK